MEIINYAQEIGATTYPGRGIVLGKSKSGQYAAIEYFNKYDYKIGEQPNV